MTVLDSTARLLGKLAQLRRHRGWSEHLVRAKVRPETRDPTPVGTVRAPAPTSGAAARRPRSLSVTGPSASHRHRLAEFTLARLTTWHGQDPAVTAALDPVCGMCGRSLRSEAVHMYAVLPGPRTLRSCPAIGIAPGGRTRSRRSDAGASPLSRPTRASRTDHSPGAAPP